MFAVDSTEAVYRFMGIHAQKELIELLTHHWFFYAVVVMLMAWKIFRTGYLLPFMGGKFGLVSPQERTMSVTKLVFTLSVSIILLAALKPQRTLTIRNFAGENWVNHSTASRTIDEATPKANVLFAYLAQGSEEIAGLAHTFFNSIFKGGQANNESPRWIFRAMIQATAAHVDDPKLLDMIETYGEACLEPVMMDLQKQDFWLSFTRNRHLRAKLEELHPFGGEKTCLELQVDLAMEIREWAGKSPNTAWMFDMQPYGVTDIIPEFGGYNWFINTMAANALTNHARNMEGRAIGSIDNPDGTDMRQRFGIWQSIRKVFTVEQWERWLGGESAGGSISALSASEELTQMMRLAPEVKGRILFYLIAIFPLFLFWGALMGSFGPILFWLTTYFSICMWEPLWALSYNVLMVQIQTHDVLRAVGELKDAISLTAADLLRARFNRAIEAYVWTQFGIAALVTSFAVWMSKDWLRSGQRESLPGGWLMRKLV